MTTIRRLTDSTMLVTTDDGASLLDPGFHSFGSDQIDLDTIGDVTQVLVTHEHADHANPEFIRWLIDRGTDVTVYSNQAVADLLAKHDIEVSTSIPPGASIEDVPHEPLPSGATPPNRAFTVGDALTHPGDSWALTRSAPVAALPLMTPWGSIGGAIEFARRIRPAQVIPVHDFYLNEMGREWVIKMATPVLEAAGIEVVALGWGGSMTV